MSKYYVSKPYGGAKISRLSRPFEVLSKHSLAKTAPSIGLPSVQRHALVREFLFVEALKRVDIALPSCDDEAAGMTAVASSFEGDPAIVSRMKSGDTS